MIDYYLQRVKQKSSWWVSVYVEKIFADDVADNAFDERVRQRRRSDEN